jgi:hypothetical protein
MCNASPSQPPHPPAAEDDSGLTKHATYAELESIECDVSAFPQAEFFRVEVGRRH